ncbi:cytoplasmic polyadenylated homeobox-like protein [Cavia porcellus]|uniref:cytoplasmic polyadenylated homeobox-like protein n=1 Tax=Cavia porcellus TaxID=10141 RepID=UPI002FE30615
MAPKGSSSKKDDYKKAQVKQCGKRKARPPHKFTQDELQILKRSFEENPYPNYSTKVELARVLQCQLYVIDNWFQGQRCRLPPAEKKRIFAMKKLNRFLVQKSQSLLSPNSLAQLDNSSMQDTTLHDQETLLHRGGFSYLETQAIPSGCVCSGDAAFTGIEEDPRSPLEFQNLPESGASYTSPPAKFIYSNTSLQYFESARYEPENSYYSLPFTPHDIFTGQGTGQQQEGQKVYFQCMTFQGQQGSPWEYRVQQLPQPQYYLENYQLPSHDQFLANQNPSDLGQQEPNLASEQQSPGASLSSLLQQAPMQIAERSPSPLW